MSPQYDNIEGLNTKASSIKVYHYIKIVMKKSRISKSKYSFIIFNIYSSLSLI